MEKFTRMHEELQRSENMFDSLFFNYENNSIMVASINFPFLDVSSEELLV